MRIHREGLHKEHMAEKINYDFQINRPENVHFYTEKPNNNPYLLMKMRNEGKNINGVDYEEKLRDDNPNTQLNEQVSTKLKTVTHTPKDKWNVPQTTAQEIGWMSDVVVAVGRSSRRRTGGSSTSGRGVPRRTTPTATTPCATPRSSARRARRTPTSEGPLIALIKEANFKTLDITIAK